MSVYFEIDRETDKNIFACSKVNNGCEPHFHSNIEVLYVLSGEISVTINGKSGILTQDDISVADSYDIHAYKTRNNSRVMMLIIPLEMARAYQTLYQGKTFSSPFLPKCAQTAEIFSVLTQFFRPYSPDDLLIFTGFVSVILGLLSSSIGTVERKDPSGRDLARQILIYLEKNYLEDVSIESLARHFGYNRDYLSRFFNSNLGCGFNRYINALRSRHAAQLIMCDNMSLTEIADKSGFDNYRTFNRAFQSVYGVTPSEYRNISANPHEVRRIYAVPHAINLQEQA